MLTRQRIKENVEKNNCKLVKSDYYETFIDCNDFTIMNTKGFPWFAYVPDKEFDSIKRDLSVDFPVRKISMGFWEKIGSWGKIKDLKINDEVFIDLDEDILKEYTNKNVKSALNRIEKLKAISGKTSIKNVNIKDLIEKTAMEIGVTLAKLAEKKYEVVFGEDVVCEPDTIITKPWNPKNVNNYSYKINIICVVPHISNTIKEKMLQMGNLSIIKDSKSNFVRSIFPIKEKMYLNEIVFFDESFEKTPYISFIIDKDMLINGQFAKTIRGALRRKS